jgi:hypothetical protein
MKDLVNAGKHFPQTPSGSNEREPNYSPGISLDHGDPSTVYLSRFVDNQCEIEQWITTDGGESWDTIVITKGSEKRNVRPIVAWPQPYGSEQPEKKSCSGCTGITYITPIIPLELNTAFLRIRPSADSLNPIFNPIESWPLVLRYSISVEKSCGEPQRIRHPDLSADCRKGFLSYGMTEMFTELNHAQEVIHELLVRRYHDHSRRIITKPPSRHNQIFRCRDAVFLHP